LSADGAVWTLSDTNGIRLIHYASPDEPGREVPAEFDAWPWDGVPSTNGGIWRGLDGSLTLFGPDLRPRAAKLPAVLTNSFLYLSPNGRFLVHHLREKKAWAAWDLAAERQIWEVAVGNFGMRALAISRDSQLVALGSGNGKLLVLE